MLLPHERVGNDFSWLQSCGPELSNDRPTDDLEDEESFLYGDISEKTTNQYVPSKSSPLVSQQTYQQNPMFENLGELFNLKPPPQVSSAIAVKPEPKSTWQEHSSCTHDMKDHKNFQEMLKNMGLNLASVDISKLFVKTEEKDHSPTHTSGPEQNPPVFPAVGDPNARQALETLQSLIKGESPFLNQDSNKHVSRVY